jgi:hypothetical protein
LVDKALSVSTGLFIFSAIVYAVALFKSLGAYEGWKQERLELYRPGLGSNVHFYSYFYTPQRALMVIVGATIFAGFPAIFLLHSIKRTRARTNQERREAEETLTEG